MNGYKNFLSFGDSPLVEFFCVDILKLFHGFPFVFLEKDYFVNENEKESIVDFSDICGI
jgi:hypothetical protein